MKHFSKSNINVNQQSRREGNNQKSLSSICTEEMAAAHSF